MTAFATGDLHNRMHDAPYHGALDGLRGLAVGLVVLQAYGFPPQGGFVGIDILLVLIGFSVGDALWRELDATREIRAKAFVARVVSGVLPATLLMIATVLICAWLILLPLDFSALAHEVLAAVPMLSNLVFWTVGQPVDGSGSILFNLWPVALAIQATGLTLLAFVMAGEATEKVRLWLAVVCLTSLAGCIAVTPLSQSAAIYLPFFRAWEVFAGALLAIQMNKGMQGRVLYAWFGAAILVATMVNLPLSPFFPGLLVLLPTLGTLFLISGADQNSRIRRVLCHPVLQRLGELSLALYLWFWPVKAFGEYLRGAPLGLAASIGFIGLSLFLAWITKHALSNERIRKDKRMRRATPAATIAMGLALFAIGLAILRSDGFPGRFDAQTRLHLAASMTTAIPCDTPENGPLMGIRLCHFGPDGPPAVLVWGDEQAEAFYPGLDAAAHAAGTPGLMIARTGCPPVFGIRKTDAHSSHAKDTACTAANLQIRQALGRLDSVESILLVGRWAFYTSGRGIGLDADRSVAVHDIDEKRAADSQALTFIRQARDTVAYLRQQIDAVHVLRQPPEIPMYDAALAARETARTNIPFAARSVTRSTVPRAELALRAALADAPWATLSERGAIGIVNIWPALCDAQQCAALHDGQGYYRDNARLSDAGALSVSRFFDPVFAPESRAILTGTSQP